MTCIVGLVEGNKVYMGGDSAGVAGWNLCVRSDVKVFKNGPMIFGFTTSFRMGQLLRYALDIPPRHVDVDVDKYMVTTFIDAVRNCLKNNGWASKNNEHEQGGTFLVGYEGRLFRIEEDYQVGIPADGFDACGCGEAFAVGALFATKALSDHRNTELATPEGRIMLALAAAEHRSAGVRAPFHIEVLE